MPVARELPPSVALAPDLEVRFVHEGSFSQAVVRRRTRVDEGYDLRLKSWDDHRTARDVIESNLMARVRRVYCRPAV